MKSHLLILWAVALGWMAGSCALPTSGPAGSDRLPAPTGVTVLTGDTAVQLNWTAVPKATGYTVYSSTDSSVSPTHGTATQTNSAPVVIHGLTNGTTHYFVVTARNDQGESTASSPVSATPLVKPAGPGHLAALAGDQTVDLSWDPVAGATSYQLSYMGQGDSGNTVVPVAGLTYHLTGLTNQKIYAFSVVALGAWGASLSSTPANAIPGTWTPPAPSSVAATLDGTSATVTWQAVDGGVKYNLYWSTTPGTEMSSGTKVSGVQSPAVISGLAKGTKAYFVVTAANANAESPASTEVSVSVLDLVNPETADLQGVWKGSYPYISAGENSVFQETQNFNADGTWLLQSHETKTNADSTIVETYREAQGTWSVAAGRLTTVQNQVRSASAPFTDGSGWTNVSRTYLRTVVITGGNLYGAMNAWGLVVVKSTGTPTENSLVGDWVGDTTDTDPSFNYPYPRLQITETFTATQTSGILTMEDPDGTVRNGPISSPTVNYTWDPVTHETTRDGTTNGRVLRVGPYIIFCPLGASDAGYVKQ